MFLRRGCAKLWSEEKPFGFRGSKDGQMFGGARSPASEAYSLYAATPQGQRNAADGRHAAPGLGNCTKREAQYGKLLVCVNRGRRKRVTPGCDRHAAPGSGGLFLEVVGDLFGDVAGMVADLLQVP